MPSLLDSGRIVFPLDSTSLSVKESARRCPSLLEPFTLPFSVRRWQKRLPSACPFGTGVRLHLKILQEPNCPISAMLHAMTRVYRTTRLMVRVGSRESLTPHPLSLGFPKFATLLDLDVGLCDRDQALTSEQSQLYQNRNNVNNNIDIVVYFVRSVLQDGDKLNGCAAPGGEPSVAVASIASRWTLAHEVGHKLGLRHITGEHVGCPTDDPECCKSFDNTRLMTGCGTRRIPKEPTPTLSATEINTMQTSRFTQIVVSGF